MIMIIITAILAWLIGYQIYNKDLLLITGKYNYDISWPQILTYISALLAVLSLYVSDGNVLHDGLIALIAFVGVSFSEFLLSRISSKRVFFSIGYRIFIVIVMYILLRYLGNNSFFPFFLMGWYVRNCMFGVPHRKSLIVAELFTHHLKTYSNSEVSPVVIPKGMPNFCHAGNKVGMHNELNLYNAADYGIFPNTEEDLIYKVQSLIDEIGAKGGGIIFFPKGKYKFNKKGKKEFLQINYSHITIEGEIDGNGKLLTEFVNYGKTVYGERNPWLSPFFITTGEKLQCSNIFFGLQLRKRKNIVMRSGSMTDPGSDGEILTPLYATRVINNSMKGEDVIYVEDSSKIGKYVMLGMYNVNGDDSLLKDILGQDVIRSVWQAASRAKEEEAPSFQWLVEVKEIIDTHTIRLVQPLWRDCEMCYEPAIFNVPMLEDISICNLKINSTWNGMFRHHGHKRYYNVSQAQEMDYGWNGINMKRVAHGRIENVVIKNFTNPLYVMDSRNITCEHIIIKGHDGHQGIKIYEHACDNLFRDIKFYCHYADMMGGEGNAYGNVFTEVSYVNPCFKPVHFDFHGFSECPMSPPSYNLFDNVHGFSFISSSGSEHMMPSCGRTNVWWNCCFEGEKKDSLIFWQRYSPVLSTRNKLKATAKAAILTLKKKEFTYAKFKENLRVVNIIFKNSWIMDYNEISKLYTDFYLYGLYTKGRVDLLDHDIIHIENFNNLCIPKTLC